MICVPAYDPAYYHAPYLTVCLVSDCETPVIKDIDRTIGVPVAVLHGTHLADLIPQVVTPWWMLLYKYEYLSRGLLRALPLLISQAAFDSYDGFVFFRADVMDKTKITYHTRLVKSLVSYDTDKLRPITGTRYERILDGWVIYDKNTIRHE